MAQYVHTNACAEEIPISLSAIKRIGQHFITTFGTGRSKASSCRNDHLLKFTVLKDRKRSLLLWELRQEPWPRPLIKSPAQVFLIHQSSIHQSFNHLWVAAAARPSLPTRAHQILHSGQKRSCRSSGNTRSITRRNLLSNCKLFPPSSNTFDTNSFLFFFIPPLRDLLPGPFLVPQLQPCLPAVPVFLQRFPSHPVPVSAPEFVPRTVQPHQPASTPGPSTQNSPFWFWFFPPVPAIFFPPSRFREVVYHFSPRCIPLWLNRPFGH